MYAETNFYVLIKTDATKVLGFTIYSGFVERTVGLTEHKQPSANFTEVEVTSFENNNKRFTGTLFTNLAFALSEADRITKTIKQLDDTVVSLRPLSLIELQTMINLWR